jgi:hypothetical protein
VCRVKCSTLVLKRHVENALWCREYMWLTVHHSHSKRCRTGVDPTSILTFLLTVGTLISHEIGAIQPTTEPLPLGLRQVFRGFGRGQERYECDRTGDMKRILRGSCAPGSSGLTRLKISPYGHVH